MPRVKFSPRGYKLPAPGRNNHAQGELVESQHTIPIDIATSPAPQARKNVIDRYSSMQDGNLIKAPQTSLFARDFREFSGISLAMVWLRQHNYPACEEPYLLHAFMTLKEIAACDANDH